MNIIEQVNFHSVQGNNSKNITNYTPIDSTKIPTKNHNDTVTLSPDALAYHEKELREKGSLPSWQSDYRPPSNILNLNGVDDKAIAETGKYFAMHDNAYADGKITTSEQKALDGYRDNMTANQKVRDRTMFNTQHGAELNEYSKIFNEAFASARKNNDIEESFVLNDFTVSQEINESVHQEFRDILFSNPRTKPLMDILGIK